MLWRSPSLNRRQLRKAVDFKIQIGEKVLDEKGMIKPGYGIGAPQWLPHKTLSLHKSEVITVKLTIQEVWTNKAFKKLNDDVGEVNVKLGNLEKKLDKVIKINKALKPRCPICFEKMGATTKIAQCLSGNILLIFDWSLFNEFGLRSFSVLDL